MLSTLKIYLPITLCFAIIIGCADEQTPLVIDELDAEPVFVPTSLDADVFDEEMNGGRLARPLAAFGEPCDSNPDCESGFCVPYGEGNLCTRLCLSGDCPTEWGCRAVSNTGTDATFICFPQDARLCRPCGMDSDCPDGLCYELDGQRVCGSDCEVDEDCPEGYQCGEVGPAGERLCTPTSNSCTCNQNNEGDLRVCERMNDAGACLGRQACLGESGWGTCDAQEPTEELCNQIDDDCNGITDDFPQVGETCERTAEVDEVTYRCTGRYLCKEGNLEPVCTAQTPEQERCDLIDNDCDGVTDETFSERDQVCVVGTGACQRFGVFVCSDDGLSVGCNVVAGQSDDEICDGIDNDCDGVIDEDYPGVGAPCFEGQGACRQAGTLNCASDQLSIACSARPLTPMNERCDTIDNDCDGRIDEAFPDVGQLCQVGQGSCRQTGVLRCSADQSQVLCDAQEGVSEIERCDGLDNDCDGRLDEDFQDLGLPCTEGEGICERRSVFSCSPDTLTVTCPVEEGLPEAERCDGLDNDCDGETDEDYPTLNQACQEGVGACLTIGVTRCAQDESTVICIYDGTTVTPSDERCDAIDNDCDGQIDEAFPSLRSVCHVGEGRCRNTGLIECSDDQLSAVCGVSPTEAEPEKCDGLDNDCDGNTDETFPTLGELCTAGEGVCRQTAVTQCSADGLSANCILEGGTQPSLERCDGLDNDCDGSIDEAFVQLNQQCSVGTGACQRRGLQICNLAGTTVTCSVTPGDPEAERCDGIDNNCDGFTDEGFDNVGLPCEVGLGLCREVGVIQCASDGASAICSAIEGLPVEERCDGLDNDCDGSVDETFLDLGTPCSLGVGVCQRNGVIACQPGGLIALCSAEPTPPAAFDICDQLDNDCDGKVDETFTELGDLCDVGTGACLRRGTYRCAESGDAVSCSAAQGTPEIERCDGVDNDCDGTTDEGWPALGETCSLGTGVCERSGVFECDPTSPLNAERCNAEPAEANELDRCDYQDDDCDGTVDEDFITDGNYTTLADCGACGSDCTTLWNPSPEAFGVSPTCEEIGGLIQCSYTCLSGFFDVDGLSNNGCEFIPDPLAIYVSPESFGGVNAVDCGTPTRPCSTIELGISQALAAGLSRVRVSEGVYREALALTAGIELIGGHQRSTWVFAPNVSVSHIDPRGLISPTSGTLHRFGVIADGITTPTLLEGFLITADSPGFGGNSYGLYIKDSNEQFIVRNNRIVAGDGGVGQTGTIGSLGQAGVNGTEGQDSFNLQINVCNSAVLNSGGAGGANTCDGIDVSGGKGGESRCPIYNQPGIAPEAGRSALGGDAGITSNMKSSNSPSRCFVPDPPREGTAGQSGRSGETGLGGLQSNDRNGSVSTSHWQGSVGESGQVGQAGGGGGGGGASPGVQINHGESPNEEDIGASGGGGGAGGCGGGGGAAGAPGGGSFSIFITYSTANTDLNTHPIITDNELQRGFGGDGGNGGPGGGGGLGGLGGAGGEVGESSIFCSLEGGDGGSGGAGGNGGGGAGGNGGVSFDIYINNTGLNHRDYINTNTFLLDLSIPTQGRGGFGGTSDAVTGQGEDGLDGLRGNFKAN